MNKIKLKRRTQVLIHTFTKNKNSYKLFKAMDVDYFVLYVQGENGLYGNSVFFGQFLMMVKFIANNL